VAVLDFIHALCSVFAGALAGRRVRDGWPASCQWAQRVRSGEVERVIEALRIRQHELGLPEENESEESQRQKVAEALRSLENQPCATWKARRRECATTSIAVKDYRIPVATSNRRSTRSTVASRAPRNSGPAAAPWRCCNWRPNSLERDQTAHHPLEGPPNPCHRTAPLPRSLIGAAKCNLRPEKAAQPFTRGPPLHGRDRSAILAVGTHQRGREMCEGAVA
jgi:hypothetical protein